MDKYLSLLPFWNNLSHEEKQIAASSAVIHKYSKGSSIHSCNHKCLGLIYIVSGRIRLYMLSDEGKEVTLFYLDKGEICVLAAKCVISHISFHSELIAAEDTEIMVIPTPEFARLTKENVYVRCYMYELSAERFSAVMWTMQQILFYSFDKRLATYLIKESEREKGRVLKITQEQIAVDINSAREVVARMLKQFSSDGLIENKRGIIEIRDYDGLYNIIE